MKSFMINDAGLTDIVDTNNRIFVVGIVGKSDRLTTNKLPNLPFTPDPTKTGIQCFWDSKQNVLYLYLSSAFDTNNLAELISNLGNETAEEYQEEGSEGVESARKSGDFLVATGDIATNVARHFLFLVHLCHIIVLSHQTPVFDLSYLNLFKSVDDLRMEMRKDICELIPSDIHNTWKKLGRLSCPRILFYFHMCPPQLINADISKIKTLEHSLEDQIYLTLTTTSRIVNKIREDKGLFSIPRNEEFVYVNNSSAVPEDRISEMVKNLITSCESPIVLPEWHTVKKQRPTFNQFLRTHIDTLITSFDNNSYTRESGDFPCIHALPNLKTWLNVADNLYKLVLSPESDISWIRLWESLSIDTLFSQGRCVKVLPLAQAAYTEGLPPHYSSQHHAKKVEMALTMFSSIARGPLADWYKLQLEEDCNKIWQSRRLCEKLSLTGNACIQPKHTGSETDDVHSSGVRYVAACNCGRTKGSRDDPYSVKWANFEFYDNLGKDCQCGTTSETIQFPIFQPSINDFRAASVKSGNAVTATVTHSPGGSPTEWSQQSQPEALSNAMSENSEERPHNKEQTETITLISINDSHFKDKGLVRQPSTTEYLPGMLHMESPLGLLPTFSSWSLVCLGLSSLYSHNIGLSDHLHPGFLPYTNFLVPWDCAVSQVDHPPWKLNQRAGIRKGMASHFTVKIFLGMEYECPRGHRFMMSSSDSITNGSTLQKESGAKLANSDMPIYYYCPCRASKSMIAQLMRVHIVTPKAAVHITLDPKVQPIAGGPVFIPGGERPVRLTGSAYWVLRLPYIYTTERGLLPRPVNPMPASAKGRLLKGMIGVAE